LKIVGVKCVPVSLPIEPFRDAYGNYDQLNYALALVHSDEELIGVGEASPVDPSFYGETQSSIKAAIEEYVDPLIRGRNPLDIDKIESEIDHRINGNACAKAAVDMALYDLTGKALGVPVYTLLGGLSREKAPIALELGITTPEDMPRMAARLLEMGAKAIKVHVGTSPQEDIRVIKAMKDAVGDSAAIRADANGHYTTAEAIQVIREVEECELEYFEQPVAKSNLGGLRRIKQRSDTPIAVDEGVWTPQDALEICKANAADVINIKITRVGGLNKAMKIAHIAEAASLKCHVGCELEFGIAMAAKAHLALSLANAKCAAAGEFTEITILRDNIVRQPIVIKQGFIEPPNKPGLGVELDEDKMKRYTRNRWLSTPNQTLKTSPF
jgi:L-alanine-DL-glutamate epimerase-like enolase superfamily enzyme